LKYIISHTPLVKKNDEKNLIFLIYQLGNISLTSKVKEKLKKKIEFVISLNFKDPIEIPQNLTFHFKLTPKNKKTKQLHTLSNRASPTRAHTDFHFHQQDVNTKSKPRTPRNRLSLSLKSILKQ
jgi:hypothetical protein